MTEKQKTKSLRRHVWEDFKDEAYRSLTARPDQRSINGEKKPSNAVLQNPKNCTEHDTAECEGLPKWKSNASSPLPYRI